MSQDPYWKRSLNGAQLKWIIYNVGLKLYEERFTSLLKWMKDNDEWRNAEREHTEIETRITGINTQIKNLRKQRKALYAMKRVVFNPWKTLMRASFNRKVLPSNIEDLVRIELLKTLRAEAEEGKLLKPEVPLEHRRPTYDPAKAYFIGEPVEIKMGAVWHKNAVVTMPKFTAANARNNYQRKHLTGKVRVQYKGKEYHLHPDRVRKTTRDIMEQQEGGPQ